MSSIEKLRHSCPVILPSMLQNDFSNIAGVCSKLELANVEALHLDVMDGRFVPNISYGLPIVDAFRKSTKLILDCHLMIEEPEKYIDSFVAAGADIVTFHVEATNNVAECIQKIKEAGADVGLALNPNTPVDTIAEFTSSCDLVLIMSVHAGFGGQSFIEESIDRIQQARQLDGNFLLEVDGGINTSTIQRCAQAGIDLFVAGSAIFGKEDYAEAVSELKRLAEVDKQNA